MEWVDEFGIILSVDVEGHAHKGKGEGGGQFTSNQSAHLNDVSRDSETEGTRLNVLGEGGRTPFFEPKSEMTDEDLASLKGQTSPQAPGVEIGSALHQQIGSAWDTVSKLWPEMTRKLKHIRHFTPEEMTQQRFHPTAALDLANKTLAIPANGGVLNPEILWHELVHLEQVERGDFFKAPHKNANGTLTAHGQLMESEAHQRGNMQGRKLIARYNNITTQQKQIHHESPVTTKSPGGWGELSLAMSSDSWQQQPDAALALYANEIQRECLLAAGDDVDAGLMAAEIILGLDASGHQHKEKGKGGGRFISSSGVSIKWLLDNYLNKIGLSIDSGPINTFFSHDIHNRAAQGILNRAVVAAKKMSAQARRELASALKQRGSGGAILNWLDKYRVELARILTNTQLASVLAGAQEIAAKVPPLGSVPTTGLPVAEQERILAATGGIAPPVDIPKPEPGEPEELHFPIIEEAVKELADKRVLTRPEFDELEAAARAKAFTVANVQAKETLEKIRDSLSNNIREGADYGTWSEKVVDEVDAGTFLSDAHQEAVFRTNVQTAFSDGQMSVLQHPLIRSGFPYADYDAIHDDRVRENHLALEKLGIQGTNTYRNDDPVFQLFRPPWDYNDRCSWAPKTVQQAAEAGIEEAKKWLETGVEPYPPAHVDMPPFQPPPEFKRSLAGAPLSIQLSLEPMAVFSTDIYEEDDGIALAAFKGVPGIPAGTPGLRWGPKPPGPGWVLVYTGPSGGQLWQSPKSYAKSAAAGAPHTTGTTTPTTPTIPTTPPPAPTPNVLHKGANVITGVPAAAPSPPVPDYYQPPLPRLTPVAAYVDIHPDPYGRNKSKSNLPAMKSSIDYMDVDTFQNTESSLSADFSISKTRNSFTIECYEHNPSGYKVYAGWTGQTKPTSGGSGAYVIKVLDGTGAVVSTYSSPSARDETYVKDRAVQVAHWMESEIKRIAALKSSSTVSPHLAQFAWDYAQAAGQKPGHVPFSIKDADAGDTSNRQKMDAYLRTAFPKLIGARQHSPHGGMDTIEHTMNIVNPANLRTAGLSPRDAELLRLGMLYHDVGKQYDPLDHEHPRASAKDAEPLLWQYGLTPEEARDTLAIIKWHDAYGDAMKAGSGNTQVAKVARLAYEYTDDSLPQDKRVAAAHRINDLLMRAWQSDLATIPGLTADPVPGRPDITVSGSIHVDTAGPAFKAKVAAMIDGIVAGAPKSAPLPKAPPTPAIGAGPRPNLVAKGKKWGELVQRADNFLVGQPVPHGAAKEPPKEVYSEARKNPELNYARAFNMGYDGPTGDVIDVYHGISSNFKVAGPGILNTGIRAGNTGDNVFGHGIYTVVNGADNIPGSYGGDGTVQLELHTGRTVSHNDLTNRVVPAWRKANPTDAKKLQYSSVEGEQTAAALWAGYSTIAVNYGASVPTLVVLDPARIRVKQVVESKSNKYKGQTISTVHGRITSNTLSAAEIKTPAGDPNHVKVKNGVPQTWDGAARTS